MDKWDSSTEIHRTDYHAVFDEFVLVNGRYKRLKDRYKPEFWLDHSCDEWLIGDIDNAKKFVARLQELIDEVDRGGE